MAGKRHERGDTARARTRRLAAKNAAFLRGLRVAPRCGSDGPLLPPRARRRPRRRARSAPPSDTRCRDGGGRRQRGARRRDLLAPNRGRGDAFAYDAVGAGVRHRRGRRIRLARPGRPGRADRPRFERMARRARRRHRACRRSTERRRFVRRRGRSGANPPAGDPGLGEPHADDALRRCPDLDRVPSQRGVRRPAKRLGAARRRSFDGGIRPRRDVRRRRALGPRYPRDSARRRRRGLASICRERAEPWRHQGHRLRPRRGRGGRGRVPTDARPGDGPLVGRRGVYVRGRA